MAINNKKAQGYGAMIGSLAALAFIPGVNGAALGALAVAGLIRVVQGKAEES